MYKHSVVNVISSILTLMIELTIYHVDAFSNTPFSGNPAAVVPLEAWLADPLLQQIAQQNNLSETAFYVNNGDEYDLRWFTPTQEVPLCGHATLASAHVILRHQHCNEKSVMFNTKSGQLTVREDKQSGLLAMRLPRYLPIAQTEIANITASLGARPSLVFTTANDVNIYAVFDAEANVRALRPNFEQLAFSQRPVGVTAPGDSCDFVSRFFAPSLGVPEDPVTGSLHCGLIPYWSARLGKMELYARQISRRGGELWCTDAKDHVVVAGHTRLYLQGTIWC